MSDKGIFDDYADKLSKTELYAYECQILDRDNKIAELEAMKPTRLQQEILELLDKCDLDRKRAALLFMRRLADSEVRG